MYICGTDGQTTDENIIRRMRYACWITKPENIYSEYVNTYCFSTAKIVTRTHLNITLNVHYFSRIFQEQVFSIAQYKICARLGRYAVNGGNYLPTTFRDNLSVLSLRAKKSFFTVEDGTERLSRNVSTKLRLLVA